MTSLMRFVLLYPMKGNALAQSSLQFTSSKNSVKYLLRFFVFMIALWAVGCATAASFPSGFNCGRLTNEQNRAACYLNQGQRDPNTAVLSSAVPPTNQQQIGVRANSGLFSVGFPCERLTNAQAREACFSSQGRHDPNTPFTNTASTTERDRLNVEIEVDRRKRQELEQQLASIKERDRITAELEAERRKSQELQAELERAKELAESRLTERPRPQSAQRPERRVALVIGNAQYKSSPLENSVNDATDIDQTLKRFGFQTTFLRNASLSQMREATRRFADQLTSADVALIYFAGHGIESKNRNYLIPVNADLKFEYELADQAYDAAAWLEMLEMIKSNNTERVNIVILDACRNNNLIGSRSLNRGLGRMDAPAGTFLSYSTAPGKVAADGSKGERNSPFTRNLLKAIQQPGQPIEEVFKEVRRNVTRETNGAQVPWESTSLTGFFSFRQTR
jgi:hypothetical protein